MKEQWLKIKEWWSNLSLRDKRILSISSALCIVFVFARLLMLPLFGLADTMRQRFQTEQATLTWMRKTDGEIQKISHQDIRKNQTLTPVILLGVLQKQITKAGLQAYLTQLKQINHESITMHFQKVEFDQLMKLLVTILNEQNVSISQMSAVSITTPGLVNAEINLKSEHG